MRATAYAALGAFGATATWFGPGLACHVPPLARALDIPRTLSDPRGVALTFDDGPHPEGTPAVLELLAARRMTATFFMVGEQVRRNPALAAEAFAAGHRVAVHGDRHRNLQRLAPARVRDDLDRAAESIAVAAGVPATDHRAPYGIYTLPGLREVRGRGWTPWLWSRWGVDWRAWRTPAQIAHELTGGGLRAGDVLLLHDADTYADPGSWRNTVAALPRILDAIEEAGLRAVPVG